MILFYKVVLLIKAYICPMAHRALPLALCPPPAAPAGEYFYNRTTKQLYLWHNGTGAPSAAADFVVPTKQAPAPSPRLACALLSLSCPQYLTQRDHKARSIV